MAKKEVKKTCKEAAVKTVKVVEHESPSCILEAFEKIVELAKDSNFSDKFFEEAGVYLSYGSEILGLTPIQTALLALFVDRSEKLIVCSDVARYAGCSTTRLLRLMNEIDALCDRHYLKVSRNGEATRYRVPIDVLTALRRNEAYEFKRETVVDLESFFDVYSRLINEKDESELNYDGLLNETQIILENIKDTPFGKRTLQIFDDDERLVFVHIAYLYVEDRDDQVGLWDLRKIFDNNDVPRILKNALKTGHSQLQLEDLIEYNNEDGMVRSDCYCLTRYSKDELLGELHLELSSSADRGITRHESLKEKRMFYNVEERNQIEELGSILSEERFSRVQERMEKAGMRKGFCCLLYGGPGTGKTETVYQIARSTGRDLMVVEVDKVKSCWVGESEKNIKALFQRYHRVCKNSALAPILFFNEADAVLGVRMEGASRAVDKMENSIQNIILQEMEKLEGIMIATTNLTDNLDKAFERRFLYKVKFEKPTLKARTMIWREMLPGLTEREGLLLAGKYDFSGGEIENVSRKHTVKAILKGTEKIDIEELMDLCRQERLKGNAHSSLGFRI